MERIKGNGIFEGIVKAETCISKKKKEEVLVYKILQESIEDELRRFFSAVNEAKEELRGLIESLEGKVEQNDLKILNVHLMMLEDPVFISDITNKLKADMINSEKIVEIVVGKYAGMFRSLEDPVYKQRALDIEDVGEKIILNLQGRKLEKQNLQGKILVSVDLKPSEILRYHNEGINLAGIITEVGGETSHIAILAKSLGIPTLMNVSDLMNYNWENVGDVILDTRTGREVAIYKPTQEIIDWYDREIVEYEIQKDELKMLIGVPAMTRTNKRVYVHANIGGLKDLEDVKKYQPDGVGLLRTEFLYMDSPYFPTEGDQFNAYKVIAETLGKEKPVIIRTLDIGADKKLTYFEMPNEENPALGLRAIRLSMANKNMFKTQLRAILRASHYGNVKIMYPMISGVEEINEAEIVLKEAKKELREEGLPFNENIEVGIMIEVPSAAIIADILVDKADFFSIGTNDLTQYILAADRLSKEVAHIYNNYHPAVMRMVNFVAEAAVKAGKKVSICGEMGGDTLALLAFISFGIYDLSMLPQLIPKIKKIVQNIEHDSLKGLKEKILNSKTAEEVKETLNDYLLGVM